MVGALWGIPAAVLFAPLFALLLGMPVTSTPDAGPIVVVAVPVALVVGWLLGPGVAPGDRWTAFGGSIAAILIGLPLGALAYVATMLASQPAELRVGVSGPLEVVGAVAVLGLYGLVFYGAAAVIAALPITFLWGVLVQATTRLMGAYVGSTRSLPHR